MGSVPRWQRPHGAQPFPHVRTSEGPQQTLDLLGSGPQTSTPALRDSDDCGITTAV